MSFDNNIDTMISEIQWNTIEWKSYLIFFQCRVIMNWIYFHSFSIKSNRNCEMRSIFSGCVYALRNMKQNHHFFEEKIKKSRFRKWKPSKHCQCNEMLLHWNLLQVYEYNATKCAALPKLDAVVESRFLSIFRPLLDSIHMRVCVDCVNAYCNTTNTQVFVYNFIFHVFHSRCVFFSLSLPLFKFPPPTRCVYVYSILCAYTLSGKNCNENNNNNNTNPTVHTDVRIVKQILWYL